MKKVRIYLRSLLVPKDLEKKAKKEKVDVINKLLLFDSNRNGAVNDLVTKVYSGDLIIWKLDRCSGIRKITKITPKEGKEEEHWKKIKPRLICEGFIMRAPDVEEITEFPYNIEYLPYGKGKDPVIIDPTIRIYPT